MIEGMFIKPMLSGKVKEDVEEDLRFQKEHSFQWYKYHLPYLEKEEEK